MQHITHVQKLQHRDRYQALVLANAGRLHLFTGDSLPGVCTVVRKSWEKNGKWSGYAYELALAANTRSFTVRESFENGEWFAAKPSFRSVAEFFGVAEDEVKDFLQRRFPPIQQGQGSGHITINFRPAFDRISKTEADLALLDAPETVAFTQQIGSRGRERALLISHNGQLRLFRGENIPGVAAVTQAAREKAGKWSKTDYAICLTAGAEAVEIAEDFNDGTWFRGYDSIDEIAEFLKVPVAEAERFLGADHPPIKRAILGDLVVDFKPVLWRLQEAAARRGALGGETTEFQFAQELLARKREMILIFRKAGKLHLFTGRDIPGVAVVADRRRSSRRKNGDSYRLLLAAGVEPLRYDEDFDGRGWFPWWNSLKQFAAEMKVDENEARDFLARENPENCRGVVTDFAAVLRRFEQGGKALPLNRKVAETEPSGANNSPFAVLAGRRENSI